MELNNSNNRQQAPRRVRPALIPPEKPENKVQNQRPANMQTQSNLQTAQQVNEEPLIVREEPIINRVQNNVSEESLINNLAPTVNDNSEQDSSINNAEPKKKGLFGNKSKSKKTNKKANKNNADDVGQTGQTGQFMGTASANDYDDFNNILVEDDVVKELNEKDAKRRKKIKTPEQLKKAKIIKISAISGACVLIFGACVLKLVSNDQPIQYNVIDYSEYISPLENPAFSKPSGGNTETNGTGGETGTGENNGGNSTVAEDDYTLSGITLMEADEYEINRGAYIERSADVNVVTNQDTGESEQIPVKYYVGLNRISTGYSNAQNYIDKAKKQGQVDIEINAEDFNDDITLAIFDIEVKYASDFPLNADGTIPDIPAYGLNFIGKFKAEAQMDEDGQIQIVTDAENDNKETSEVEGETSESETEEIESETESVTVEYSDKFVVGDKSYDITQPIKLFSYSKIPTVSNLRNGVHYVYMLQVPKGLLGETYSIEILEGKIDTSSPDKTDDSLQVLCECKGVDLE